MSEIVAVLVIHRVHAINFILLRILSSSSRLTSLSNTNEAEILPSIINPPSDPAFLFADST